LVEEDGGDRGVVGDPVDDEHSGDAPIVPMLAGRGSDPPSAPMTYAITTTANPGVGWVSMAWKALQRISTSKPR
jgi:hypothetical protein